MSLYSDSKIDFDPDHYAATYKRPTGLNSIP